MSCPVCRVQTGHSVAVESCRRGARSVKGRSLRPAAGFLKELLGAASRCNLMRSAAALTYYFVLSVFPLMICINACVGMLHVDARALLESVGRLFPAEALGLAEDYVDYLSHNQAALLLPAGVAAMLMSGSAGVRVLLDSTDEFFGLERRVSPRRVAISVLFSFFLLVAMYLALVVVLAGGWLFGAVRRLLPAGLEGRIGLDVISGLWLNLRYLLLFSFILLLVMALYRLGIARTVRDRTVLACALICAASLVGASAVFSWLIGMSTQYSLLYGSLASVVILLLWLYLCSFILLLGALSAAVWSRRAD